MSRSLMSKSFARFRADDSGMTLIESTFVIILLVSLMITGTEIQRYFRLARHLTTGAESFADLMGQRRAPMRDLNWSEDASALAWFVPEARAETTGDWRTMIGVQATYVRFIPIDPECKANCPADQAKIVWTWAGSVPESASLLSQANVLRECGLTLLPGGETPARASLPPAFFTAQDLLVVTLAYRFRPIFLSSLFTSKLLLTQAYVPTLPDQLAIDPLGFANEVTPCP